MIVVDDGAAADQKGHDMLRTEKLLSRPHPASFAKVYRAIRSWTEKNVVKSLLAIETPRLRHRASMVEKWLMGVSVVRHGV